MGLNSNKNTDNKDNPSINPLKLKSVANKMEAELLMNLLKNNNIPCYSRSRGTGDYLKIYMGYSIFGEDIYVNEENFEEATNILASLEPNEATKEPNSSLDNPVPRKKIPSYLLLIFLIPFAIFMIAYLVNIIRTLTK